MGLYVACGLQPEEYCVAIRAADVDTTLFPHLRRSQISMDKKNTFLGIAFLIAAMGLMMWQSAQQVPAGTQPSQPQAAESTPGTGTLPTPAVNGTSLNPVPDAPLTLGQAVTAQTQDRPTEIRPVLENDFIRVEFTSWGGAIRDVALKNYPVEQGGDEPYLFNEFGDVPALALSRAGQSGIEEYAPAYELVEAAQDRVVFRREVSPGIFFIRSYVVSDDKEGPTPYIIRHSTTILNQSESVANLQPLYVSLGTAAPDAADRLGYNLTAGYYDGDDYDYEQVNKFTGGRFMFFFNRDPIPFLDVNRPIVWGAVKNQFFAAILTPDLPASGLQMKQVEFPFDAARNIVPRGITASARFDLSPIQPQSQTDLNMSYYVGPKEYDRLAAMEQNQDEVMQFGWSGPGGGIIAFIGKSFYTGLKAVHSVVGNWGVAIIIITILIRLLFWPLTAKAADSSRKMAKLQGPIKELREKYKDNPRKLNEEMMLLWKKHKVNPLAGCLPILIQIPIFISFYYMLRGASELRFAHFLWINDLSLPDTIAQIGGLPLNLLPLLMGVSMFYQMHLAPTPSMDATQAKIMRFMPLIFLFFCYNFSSGLVLYWTVSNCMSILQQLHTNRKRRREEESGVGATPAAAIAAPAGKQDHHGRVKVKRKRPKQ